MQIENIAELAEEIYFTVLSELALDDKQSGFIESDGHCGTKNTDRGTGLYFVIEETIKDYLESKYIKSNYPECQMCGIDNYVCLECERLQREELCQQ